MTRRIFSYSFLTGALALLLCAGLIFGLQYRKSLDEANTTLRQETAYVARGIALGGVDYLEDLPEEKRVTWMQADGSVIYDSQNLSLPNQSGYAEVRDALENGSGQAIRKSGSQSVSTMYYAQRMEDGTVLRLSLPLSAVRAALSIVSPILWVFVLVLTLSGVLAFRASRQIVEPINALDLDHPEAIRTYPELDPLVGRLKEQTLTIRDQIDQLHRRQKEFSTLVGSMSEGFLLLDREGLILAANQSASLLIPGAEQGVSFFALNGELSLGAVKLALNGERAERTFSRDGRSWSLIASPVRSHKQIVGAVLLFMDVTEREQRERLRQEFSANVSHELKTPLTSISGFAELMAQGLVPQEKVQEFAGDIHREAQRLIALVEDIIKLSKLDENALPPRQEKVELYALSADILEALRAAAEKNSVRLRLEGGPAEIVGQRQLLSEMIRNLCDNAVKYNRPGGSVTVSVERIEREVLLRVADTGIGIPEADQDRVFERFFRVDKSHSRQIGGTGLGLSIVKHGAQYHNARIELQSEPDKGTVITLHFRAQESA